MQWNGLTVVHPGQMEQTEIKECSITDINTLFWFATQWPHLVVTPNQWPQMGISAQRPQWRQEHHLICRQAAAQVKQQRGHSGGPLQVDVMGSLQLLSLRSECLPASCMATPNQTLWHEPQWPSPVWGPFGGF